MSLKVKLGTEYFRSPPGFVVGAVCWGFFLDSVSLLDVIYSNKGSSFVSAQTTCLSPDLDSSLCLMCWFLVTLFRPEPLEGAVVLLKAPSEQHGNLDLVKTVQQAPINAPVQSQMEQTNSALPLTIQITPLDILGS